MASLVTRGRGLLRVLDDPAAPGGTPIRLELVARASDFSTTTAGVGVTLDEAADYAHLILSVVRRQRLARGEG